MIPNFKVVTDFLDRIRDVKQRKQTSGTSDHHRANHPASPTCGRLAGTVHTGGGAAGSSPATGAPILLSAWFAACVLLLSVAWYDSDMLGVHGGVEFRFGAGGRAATSCTDVELEDGGGARGGGGLSLLGTLMCPLVLAGGIRSALAVTAVLVCVCVTLKKWWVSGSGASTAQAIAAGVALACNILRSYDRTNLPQDPFVNWGLLAVLCGAEPGRGLMMRGDKGRGGKTGGAAVKVSPFPWLLVWWSVAAGSYTMTTLGKLGAVEWRDGSALGYVLANGVITRSWMEEWGVVDVLVTVSPLLTYTSHLVEGGSVLACWWPRTRAAVWVGGVLLHCGILALMKLTAVSLQMLGAYIFILSLDLDVQEVLQGWVAQARGIGDTPPGAVSGIRQGRLKRRVSDTEEGLAAVSKAIVAKYAAKQAAVTAASSDSSDDDGDDAVGDIEAGGSRGVAERSPSRPLGHQQDETCGKRLIGRLKNGKGGFLGNVARVFLAVFVAGTVPLALLLNLEFPPVLDGMMHAGLLGGVITAFEAGQHPTNGNAGVRSNAFEWGSYFYPKAHASVLASFRHPGLEQAQLEVVAVDVLRGFYEAAGTVLTHGETVTFFSLATTGQGAQGVEQLLCLPSSSVSRAADIYSTVSAHQRAKQFLWNTLWKRLLADDGKVVAHLVENGEEDGTTATIPEMLRLTGTEPLEWELERVTWVWSECDLPSACTVDADTGSRAPVWAVDVTCAGGDAGGEEDEGGTFGRQADRPPRRVFDNSMFPRWYVDAIASGT